MGGEQHGRARGATLLEDVLEELGVDRIEPGERLVEDEQARAADERAAIIRSKVTGKPRCVVVFFGTEVRPSVGQPLVSLTLDVQTGDTKQLTFGGNNASAAYSPDGAYIVFNSLRNQGQADLYVMRADGHSLRRLTDNPEPDWQPQWGP